MAETKFTFDKENSITFDVAPIFIMCCAAVIHVLMVPIVHA